MIDAVELQLTKTEWVCAFEEHEHRPTSIGHAFYSIKKYNPINYCVISIRWDIHSTLQQQQQQETNTEIFYGHIKKKVSMEYTAKLVSKSHNASNKSVDLISIKKEKIN